VARILADLVDDHIEDRFFALENLEKGLVAV
jgi:hypothetical protein